MPSSQRNSHPLDSSITCDVLRLVRYYRLWFVWLIGCIMYANNLISTWKQEDFSAQHILCVNFHSIQGRHLPWKIKNEELSAVLRPIPQYYLMSQECGIFLEEKNPYQVCMRHRGFVFLSLGIKIQIFSQQIYWQYTTSAFIYIHYSNLKTGIFL